MVWVLTPVCIRREDNTQGVTKWRNTEPKHRVHMEYIESLLPYQFIKERCIDFIDVLISSLKYFVKLSFCYCYLSVSSFLLFLFSFGLVCFLLNVYDIRTPPPHSPLDLPPSIKIYFRRMLMTQNYSESRLDFEGFMAFIRQAF